MIIFGCDGNPNLENLLLKETLNYRKHSILTYPYIYNFSQKNTYF